MADPGRDASCWGELSWSLELRPQSSRRVCYIERQRFSTVTERSAFLPVQHERFKPLKIPKYLQDGAPVTGWAPIRGGLVEWRRGYLHYLHHVQADLVSSVSQRITANLFWEWASVMVRWTEKVKVLAISQSARESRIVVKKCQFLGDLMMWDCM